MTMEFTKLPHPNPASAQQRAQIMANPGFGKNFTDHMATAVWSPEQGWHDAAIKPFGPLQLSPAAAVFHYAQEVFEGLKAYRHEDGSVWTFRPQANAKRMGTSAQRLALPKVVEEDFVAAIQELVRTDIEWVPTTTAPVDSSAAEQSLYLRPFMFASEPFLGVRPANEVQFAVIASPVGAYFARGIEPVSIWLSTEYTRAAPGGTGAAKCGGNYAASLAPQLEAKQHGCDQVCFLDAAERTWIEELGGMNLFFVYRDGTLVTPELSGSILEGVTRSSIFTIAADHGLQAAERRISVTDWRKGVESGDITEVFACGTAAVINPVGSLQWDGGRVDMPAASEVTMNLRRALVDIQYGRAEDKYGWLYRLA